MSRAAPAAPLAIGAESGEPSRALPSVSFVVAVAKNCNGDIPHVL
jgi:hypothetical protein